MTWRYAIEINEMNRDDGDSLFLDNFVVEEAVEMGEPRRIFFEGTAEECEAFVQAALKWQPY